MAAYAESPIPTGDADFQTIWTFIKQGMDHIMTNPQESLTNNGYMGLYTCVYNFCNGSLILSGAKNSSKPAGRTRLKPGCPELYSNLVQYFVGYIVKIRDASDSLTNEALLRYYAREWDRYSMSVTHVDRAFKPFNRYWVVRKTYEGKNHVYPVSTLAILLWKRDFFVSLQKTSRNITPSVLKLIETRRQGVNADESVVKSVLNSFVSLGMDENGEASLGVYEEHFEEPFVAATEMFYVTESQVLSAKTTLSGYLKRAEEILRVEKDHIQLCLDTNKRERLTSRCEQLLIRDHAEKMWDGFQQLLENDQEEDLERMYRLLARNPGGLDPLYPKFEAVVKHAGQVAIANLVRKDGPNVGVLKPKLYIDTLFYVYHKYQSIVEKRFNSNKAFVSAFGKACQSFINSSTAPGESTSNVSQILVNQVDGLLRKSSESLGNGELEHGLNQTAVILKPGYPGESSISFDFRVCGAFIWPLKPPSHDFVVPWKLKSLSTAFSSFYQMRNSGRVLKWLWNHCKSELHTNYLSRSYILVTSSYQMAILLQYNSAETHSLGELSTVTLIPRDLLSRVLAPLVKLKILIAEGHEHYRLNFDFRSDNTRVYTDVALEAVEDDIKTTEDDVKALEDRKRLIQFTVSKCVKDYKRIKTQSLIQETLTRLNNRLSPTIKEIKVAIEVCIEKEYIGRVEGQRDTLFHIP
ncbi:hypothetical protein FRC20_002778 [Serendipita sp. 405]|nr:hypothetical protein FRC20_002778 [Serendipita sp. 405]